MLAPAAALLVTIFAMPILRLDWQVMLWTLITVTVGVVLYPLLQTARTRGWCEFVCTPHEFRSNLYGSYAQLPIVVNGAPVLPAEALVGDRASPREPMTPESANGGVQ